MKNERLKIKHEDKLKTLNKNSSNSSKLANLEPQDLLGMTISNQSSRHTRSPGNITKPPKSQYDQLCRRFGRQPCTCYYPDHPNVAIFESSSDEITSSKMNGTGPSNCTDLQSIGFNLRGFYMVRLNNKRIKTIYCYFNDTSENTNMKITTLPSTTQSGDSVYQEFSQFCKGLTSQPCTALYSDYPDISLFHLKRDKTSKNYFREPTSCEDLHVIGYFLKGFYWVSTTVKKVKVVYCDFDEIEEKVKKNLRTKRFASQNSTSSTSSNKSTSFLPNCDAFGSQPCSCYYSTSPDILQFELSNDQLTRQALSDNNGTGPKSCEELKNIGYSFDGFYVVRSSFKTKKIKIVYCLFNYTEEKPSPPAAENMVTQAALTPHSKSSLTGKLT